MSTELFLIGNNGFTAKVHKSMTIGRDWCRVFNENYKWVSDQQFRIEQAEGTWKIEGLRGLVNPTLQNGTEITGKNTVLSHEDVITIGHLNLNVKIVGDVFEKKEYKKLIFKWNDHTGQSWNLSFDYPIKSVRDSQKEFGLSKEFAFDSSYIDRKGFKKKGMYLSVNYPIIADRNVSRTTDVAKKLRYMLEPGLRNNKLNLLSFFLSFVQSIPYRVPPDKSKSRKIYGFFTPPEVLYWGFGDCDSKSVLLASLWRNIFSNPIAFVEVPNHLLLSFSNIVQSQELLGKEYISLNGAEYLLCEAAGPGLWPPGEGTTLINNNLTYQTYIF